MTERHFFAAFPFSYSGDRNSWIFRKRSACAGLTTFKSEARHAILRGSPNGSEVTTAVDFMSSKALPLFVLGGGSNLVISDAGWPGLVLKIAMRGTDERSEDGKRLFEVGAGEEWDKFVACAVARNCAGVECLSGIPGSVGGTPVQNVGAYGQEVSETIESVLALDLKDGQLREFCNEACGFSYRASIFNTTERGRFIIVRVTYSLTPGGEPRIQYADLKKHFAGRNETPKLADARHAVRQIRAAKGMLITAGDEDCRSAGSFFKNPVLSQTAYDDLVKRAEAKGLRIPSYPAAGSMLKSLGCLAGRTLRIWQGIQQRPGGPFT